MDLKQNLDVTLIQIADGLHDAVTTFTPEIDDKIIAAMAALGPVKLALLLALVQEVKPDATMDSLKATLAKVTLRLQQEKALVESGDAQQIEDALRKAATHPTILGFIMKLL